MPTTRRFGMFSYLHSAPRSCNHWRYPQPGSGLRIATMSKERFHTYLSAQRRRWGLTQKELAFLLGYKSASIVSRLERQKSKPEYQTAHSLRIIFGVTPMQLFPSLSDDAEQSVVNRVHALREKLTTDQSRSANLKRELLENAIARARRQATEESV